ncbi:MAG: amidohydrolase family protein, partial [Candidatus Binatia bacterium]
VFERHPNLKLVITEQNADWWTASMREFDSSYFTHRYMLVDQMPRKPSEYCRTNVFIGASFAARFGAEDAVRNGYSGNFIWGRDYPHIEGTFIHTDDDDPATNPTRLSQRYTFCNLPPAEIPKMVGLNGIRAYGLDGAELATVATKIGAPTLRELTTPIAAIPENGGVQAFRQIGPWG